MAHWIGEGGGGSPSAPVSPVKPPVSTAPVRGTVQPGARIRNFTDDEQEYQYLIAQKDYWRYKDKKKSKYYGDMAVQLAIVNRSVNKPLGKYQRKKKETDLDDIAKILLAIAGYGAYIPGPYGTAYKAMARTGRRYARNAYYQRISAGHRSRSGYTGNPRKSPFNQYENRR